MKREKKEKNIVKIYRPKNIMIPAPIVEALQKSKDYSLDRKCAEIMQAQYVMETLDELIAEGLKPEIKEVGEPRVMNVNKLPINPRGKSPFQRDWFHKARR